MLQWAREPQNDALNRDLEDSWQETVAKRYPNLEHVWLEADMNEMVAEGGGNDGRALLEGFFNELGDWEKWRSVELGDLPSATCDFLFTYSIGGWPSETGDDGPGISYDYGGDQDVDLVIFPPDMLSLTVPQDSNINVMSRDTSTTLGKNTTNQNSTLRHTNGEEGPEKDFDAKDKLENHRKIIFGDKCSSLELLRDVDEPESALTYDDISAHLIENDCGLLEDRADGVGRPRSYTSKKSSRFPISIQSAEYPNGDGGDNLLRLNQDSHRYRVTVKTLTGYACRANRHKLTTDSLKGSYKWVTEHILELQTIPRFVDFMIDQSYPAIPGWNIPSKPHSRTIDITQAEIQRYMANPKWNAWQNKGSDYANISPLDLMMKMLGSFDDSSVLVVASDDLNAIKSRVWQLDNYHTV